MKKQNIPAFPRHLLLLDLETTGTDERVHEIIQLSAVLLDRKTLREVKHFSSYAKPVRWAKREREAMAVNKLTPAELRNAPALANVLRSFSRAFKPAEVVLCHYGSSLDINFLKNAFRDNRLPWRFDYHYFNLFGLFWTYLALKRDLKNRDRFTGFSLEDLMGRFGIVSKNRHDGLEDCRVEAEILRRVMGDLA